MIFFQAASSTWFAEFKRLESNTTRLTGDRLDIKKELGVQGESQSNI